MNKHFVIDPNGEKHTRNSKTREYSHCVLARLTNESRMRSLKCGLQNASELVRKYSDPDHVERQVAYYSRPGAITKKTREQVEAEEAKYLAEYVANAKAYRTEIEVAEAAIARGEELDPTWGSIGWASRLDLAHKNAAGYQNGWHTMVVQAERE